MNKILKSVLMKIAYPFAKRFIAGKTAEDALLVAEKLNKAGLEAIINFLGEDIKTDSEAWETAQVYHYLLREIFKRKLKARVSIKPSQLGLGLQSIPSPYFANLKSLATVASYLNIPLEIDMEHFKNIDKTISATIRLKKELPMLNLRQAIQTRLWRSTVDIDNLTESGVKIRLCKGAYKDEKSELAPEKIAGNRIIYHSEELMKQKMDPAIATHDLRLIKKLINSGCENQFLLGIRKRLAQQLAKRNLRCLIYVAFGGNWLPYGLRRFRYVVKKLPSIIWDEIIMLFE